MVVIEDGIKLSERIEEKAHKIAQQIYPDELNVWARANWEAKNIEAVFKLGALEMQKEFLEISVKWLKDQSQFLNSKEFDLVVEQFNNTMKNIIKTNVCDA